MRFFAAALVGVLAAGSVQAQVQLWKLGGDGLVWDRSDSVRVFIDFERTPGAIQPVFLTQEQNILSSLSGWSPFKFPTDLDYNDGEKPRFWRAANGFYWFTAGTLTTKWVDGDSLSYTPPVSRGINSEWYTIDVGVPVPADQVGFFTPPRGFAADGSPLSEDIINAFEISIAAETDPVLNLEDNDNDYHRLETLVAELPINFERDLKLDFPKQYVRFIRFKRNQSINDLAFGTGTWGPNVQLGTIGEFVLHGEGVPKRVSYTSRITDLGQTVNFGRIFWAATPMRMVDGVPTEAPAADVRVVVEVRSGTDAEPNVYHEFTDTGKERVVSRQRYEHELKQPDQTTDGRIQDGKPGLRASVRYDTDNWSFWSFPLTQSGVQAPLRRGNHVQVRLRLESNSFFDFVRVDSLWIETSPLLVGRIVGEVAPLDQPAPARGFTEVEMGRMTEFSYDLKAEFDSNTQPGFDVLRIRTGGRPQFKRLLIGEPPVEIQPLEVVEEEDGLRLHLPERIDRRNNAPMRVVFASEIFVFANIFEAEVEDSQGADLPQQVEEGDASELVSTNSLRVLGVEDRSDRILKDLQLSGGVFTPNGDGVNDQLHIDYTLFRLPAAVPVQLNVYSLDGRLVARRALGLQGAGPQSARWDGRDEAGSLVAPGIYLLDVHLDAEAEPTRPLRTVGVAY